MADEHPFGNTAMTDKQKGRLLVINVGSTTLKLGLFTGRDFRFREKIEYTPKEIAPLNTYGDWLHFLRDTVQRNLSTKKDHIDPLDLVVSRGGLTKPLAGGAYRVSRTMLEDLRSGSYGWHPTNIGPAIAREIAMAHGVEAIVYDSPVVDEMSTLARFSGLKEIPRKAAFHVLNQKSAGRKAARSLNLPYEKSRLIVAHMGGGITVGAHSGGKIIDSTHGLSEGPFTPQRTGMLPNLDLMDLCFSGTYSKEELRAMLLGRGGVFSYLGEQDMTKVEESISRGDRQALLVVEAMAYQISKNICAMSAVLEGNVDAVVLTGSLCYFSTLVEEIRKRVSFRGVTLVYPGEDELENLARGGLGVLTDGEEIREY